MVIIKSNISDRFVGPESWEIRNFAKNQNLGVGIAPMERSRDVRAWKNVIGAQRSLTATKIAVPRFGEIKMSSLA